VRGAVAAHAVHYEPEANACARVSKANATAEARMAERALWETRVHLPEQLVAKAEIAGGAVSVGQLLFLHSRVNGLRPENLYTVEFAAT
jgi:hypothetical protein